MSKSIARNEPDRNDGAVILIVVIIYALFLRGVTQILLN